MDCLQSDGKTPLEDVIDQEELDIAVSNHPASPASTSSTPNRSSNSNVPTDSAQAFEDSLAQVYGPVKRKPTAMAFNIAPKRARHELEEVVVPTGGDDISGNASNLREVPASVEVATVNED